MNLFELSVVGRGVLSSLSSPNFLLRPLLRLVHRVGLQENQLEIQCPCGESESISQQMKVQDLQMLNSLPSLIPTSLDIDSNPLEKHSYPVTHPHYRAQRDIKISAERMSKFKEVNQRFGKQINPLKNKISKSFLQGEGTKI